MSRRAIVTAAVEFEINPSRLTEPQRNLVLQKLGEEAAEAAVKEASLHLVFDRPSRTSGEEQSGTFTVEVPELGPFDIKFVRITYDGLQRLHDQIDELSRELTALRGGGGAREAG